MEERPSVNKPVFHPQLKVFLVNRRQQKITHAGKKIGLGWTRELKSGGKKLELQVCHGDQKSFAIHLIFIASIVVDVAWIRWIFRGFG